MVYSLYLPEKPWQESMMLTRLPWVFIVLFMSLLVGACASGRLRYSPQQVPALPLLNKTVALPKAESWEACLYEADAAAPDSAAHAALMLYCSTRFPSDSSSDSRVDSALTSLSRLAYDPETQGFVDRRLAINILLTTTLSKDATYEFAGDYVTEGVRGPVLMTGLSVPLIKRTQRGETDVGTYYPPEGLFEPVGLTADVETSNDDRLTINLTPVSRPKTITKSQSALAENAYLHLLEAAELDKASWAGFVDPQRMTSHTDGIYLIERYDPTRIPILMIHGLQSNPLTWEPLTRAVLSTPDLHQRFQVWHAFYPTGLPPFYTGSRIRAALRAVLAHFDPEGDDLPSRHMAVIGHSMGGVISHMLVSNDDGALWRGTFTVQPSELRVNASRRAEMMNIFSARHEPQIGFVAFIATPHRGSDMADSPIGKIGSSLVDLPRQFTSIFQGDQVYLAQVTDDMRPYLMQGGPDSVRVLSPEHPLLRILAEIPVAEDVAHITVIGVTEGPECVPDPNCKATDGVVTYDSAWFSPPEDEKIIQAGHDVHRHPEAITFLIDRLRSWKPEREGL